MKTHTFLSNPLSRAKTALFFLFFATSLFSCKKHEPFYQNNPVKVTVTNPDGKPLLPYAPIKMHLFDPNGNRAHQFPATDFFKGPYETMEYDMLALSHANDASVVTESLNHIDELTISRVSDARSTTLLPIYSDYQVYDVRSNEVSIPLKQRTATLVVGLTDDLGKVKSVSATVRNMYEQINLKDGKGVGESIVSHDMVLLPTSNTNPTVAAFSSTNTLFPTSGNVALNYQVNYIDNDKSVMIDTVLNVPLNGGDTLLFNLDMRVRTVVDFTVSPPKGSAEDQTVYVFNATTKVLDEIFTASQLKRAAIPQGKYRAIALCNHSGYTVNAVVGQTTIDDFAITLAPGQATFGTVFSDTQEFEVNAIEQNVAFTPTALNGAVTVLFPDNNREVEWIRAKLKNSYTTLRINDRKGTGATQSIDFQITVNDKVGYPIHYGTAIAFPTNGNPEVEYSVKYKGVAEAQVVTVAGKTPLESRETQRVDIVPVVTAACKFKLDQNSGASAATLFLFDSYDEALSYKVPITLAESSHNIRHGVYKAVVVGAGQGITTAAEVGRTRYAELISVLGPNVSVVPDLFNSLAELTVNGEVAQTFTSEKKNGLANIELIDAEQLVEQVTVVLKNTCSGFNHVSNKGVGAIRTLSAIASLSNDKTRFSVNVQALPSNQNLEFDYLVKYKNNVNPVTLSFQADQPVTPGKTVHFSTDVPKVNNTTFSLTLPTGVNLSSGTVLLFNKTTRRLAYQLNQKQWVNAQIDRGKYIGIAMANTEGYTFDAVVGQTTIDDFAITLAPGQATFGTVFSDTQEFEVSTTEQNIAFTPTALNGAVTVLFPDNNREVEWIRAKLKNSYTTLRINDRKGTGATQSIDFQITVNDKVGYPIHYGTAIAFPTNGNPEVEYSVKYKGVAEAQVVTVAGKTPLESRETQRVDIVPVVTAACKFKLDQNSGAAAATLFLFDSYDEALSYKVPITLAESSHNIRHGVYKAVVVGAGQGITTAAEVGRTRYAELISVLGPNVSVVPDLFNSLAELTVNGEVAQTFTSEKKNGFVNIELVDAKQLIEQVTVVLKNTCSGFNHVSNKGVGAIRTLSAIASLSNDKTRFSVNVQALPSNQNLEFDYLVKYKNNINPVTLSFQADQPVTPGKTVRFSTDVSQTNASTFSLTLPTGVNLSNATLLLFNKSTGQLSYRLNQSQLTNTRIDPAEYIAVAIANTEGYTLDAVAGQTTIDQAAIRLNGSTTPISQFYYTREPITVDFNKQNRFDFALKEALGGLQATTRSAQAEISKTKLTLTNLYTTLSLANLAGKGTANFSYEVAMQRESSGEFASSVVPMLPSGVPATAKAAYLLANGDERNTNEISFSPGISFGKVTQIEFTPSVNSTVIVPASSSITDWESIKENEITVGSGRLIIKTVIGEFKAATQKELVDFNLEITNSKGVTERMNGLTLANHGVAVIGGNYVITPTYKLQKGEYTVKKLTVRYKDLATSGSPVVVKSLQLTFKESSGSSFAISEGSITTKELMSNVQ